MVEDFTPLMQANDNDDVNEICDCKGSQLTYSRRTRPLLHEETCPYRVFIEDRVVVLKWYPMLDSNGVEGKNLRLKVARMLEQVHAASRGARDRNVRAATY